MNFELVLVIISERATTKKNRIPKMANGKGQTTTSKHLFALSLYPLMQLVHVILSFLQDAHGFEQAVQLLVVVFV